MTKWFTSDLHFYHRRVIEYCNRPFKDVEEMTSHIMKVWNETVKPDDTIYVLGDFSLNPKWSKILVPQLNGTKILVAGNHDACHISHKKSDKFVERYKQEWNEVYPHTHTIKLKNNLNVQLSHLPFPPGKEENLDTRYLEYRPKLLGQQLLCGHLHGRFIKKGKMIDVGWDAHQKIVSEDEIIRLIEDPQDFIRSHLTEFYKNRSKDSKESAD